MATFDDIWGKREEEYPGLHPDIAAGINLAKQWAANNNIPLQVTETVRQQGVIPTGGDPNSPHYTGGAADLAWEGLQWGDNNFNGIADYLESQGYSVIRDAHGTGPHIHFSKANTPVQQSRKPITFDDFFKSSVAEAAPQPQPVGSGSTAPMEDAMLQQMNNQQAVDATQSWKGKNNFDLSKFASNASQMAKSYWNTLTESNPFEGSTYVPDSDMGPGYITKDGKFVTPDEVDKYNSEYAQRALGPAVFPLAMVPNPLQRVVAPVAGGLVVDALRQAYKGTDEKGNQQGMVGVGKTLVSPVTGLYDKFIGNPEKFQEDLSNAPAETLFNTALELGVVFAVGKGVYEMRKAKPTAEPTAEFQPSETGPVTRRYTAEDLTPASRQELLDAIRNQLEQVKQQKWDKAETTAPELQTQTVLEPTTYESWWMNNAERQPVTRTDVYKSEITPPPMPRRNAPAAEIFPQEIKPTEIIDPTITSPGSIVMPDNISNSFPFNRQTIGSEYPLSAEAVFARNRTGVNEPLPPTTINRGKLTLDETTGKLYDVTSFLDRFKGVAIKPEKGSVRAGISLAQDAKQGIIERGIQAGKQAYTDYVDSFSPIQNEVMRFEKETGLKLKPEESPYDLAKVAHTSTARAEMLVRGKTPEEIAALKQHYNLPHDVTMERVVEQLPKGKLNEFLTKEGFTTVEDAFGGYLVAKRQLELQKLNPDYVAPIETKKAAEFIAKSPAEFHQAAESFYKYNDNLLQIAVDEGLIAKEVAAAIRAKYKNYAAMSRDFADVSAMENTFGTGKGMVNVQGVLKRLTDGSERSVINPLESAVKNTYVVLSRVERNKAGRAVAELGELSDGQFFAKKTDAAPDANKSIFSVYEKGEKVNYQTTPELYRALTSMNDEGVAQIVKILSYPAGWLRAGATLDPGFFVKNVTRDAFTAGIYSKYGFVPVYDTLMGVADIIGNKKLYAEYKASGAPMSVITGMDRASISKALSTIGKDGLPNPMEALRAMTAFFEDATRIREFQKAQQAGEGIVGQTRATQEVTLNFAGKGAKGTTPNQLIAFFNAQVQGVNKLIQEHKTNPARTAGRAAMYITAPSIGLWLLNHDDVRYQELPSWQRDLFWIVPTGQKLTRDRFNELMKSGKTKQQILDEAGTLIRIPKPFELGLIYGSLPERFLDFAMNKDPKGLQKWAKTATEALIPNFMPTVAIPIIENMTNYSFFRDRPVVPRRKEGLPPSMQYTEQTTETAKFLGKQAERFTQGGVSPAKIDNAIAGYLGGLGKTTIDTAETIAQLRNGKADKLLTEQPILRSFFITPFKGADSVQEFYETYQRQSELKQAYDKTKAKDPAFNPALFMRMEQANKQVKELNKVARQIEESNQSPEKKRQALDKINLTVVGITRQALKK